MGKIRLKAQSTHLKFFSRFKLPYTFYVLNIGGYFPPLVWKHHIQVRAFWGYVHYYHSDLLFIVLITATWQKQLTGERIWLSVERMLLLAVRGQREAGVPMGSTIYSHFNGFRSRELRPEAEVDTPWRPTPMAHLCYLDHSPQGSTISQSSTTNWKQMSKCMSHSS